MAGTHDLLLRGDDGHARCWWCGSDPEYVRYHDEEWGRALHGEHRVFEKLVLEGQQAGLSWITILRKRDHFREVFAGFDIEKVAAFGPADVERLMGDPGIIRNRAKIEAAIGNARAALEILDAGESLDALCWSFRPQAHRPRPRDRSDFRTTCPEAVALSKALKKRGFRFVGPTTMYAFMQSAGMVDDHIEGCTTAPPPTSARRAKR